MPTLKLWSRSPPRYTSADVAAKRRRRLLLEPLEDRLAPATIQWDGGPSGTGTAFTTPANWVGDVLPGPGDEAVIGTAFADRSITSNGNAAVKSLTSAAALTINGGTFTVADEIAVANTFRLSSGTLKGGTVSTETVLAAAGGTLDGVTVAGTLTVAGAATATAVNGLTLTGTARLGDASGAGILRFDGPQTFGGTGTVSFESNSAANQLTARGGAVALGPGVAVRGRAGQLNTAALSGVNGAWDLRGTVAADTAGGTVIVDGTWTNNGILRAANGGTLRLQGAYSFADGSALIADPAPSFIRLEGDPAPAGEFTFVPRGVGAHSTTKLGSAANPFPIEVQSQDVGPVLSAFPSGAALDAYTFSGGYVRLVDRQDNTPGNGPEAIYTGSLSVAAGTTLDLNGFHLYTRLAQVAGTVVGGAVSVLPDSGPLAFDTPTPGTISAAGETDEWTFFGRVGQSVVVVVAPAASDPSGPPTPALGTAAVTVLDAVGKVVASGTTPSGGTAVFLTNLTLPTDGIYRVRVTTRSDRPNATGNYVLTVWNATFNTAPLTLGTATHGALNTPYETDRWTFSAVAGTQVRLTGVAAAAAGIRFGLTGPDGFVGFTDLTAGSDPVTLPATGTYVVEVTTNGTVGAYAFTLGQLSATDLALNVPFTGTLPGNAAAQLFRVNVPSIQQLLVALDDANDGDVNEVYVRYETPPTRADYDYRYSTPVSADQRVLVPSAAPGDWYVLVYGKSVPVASSYTLTVGGADVFLLGSTPDRAGDAADAELTLTGAGFTAGTAVTLVAAGGTSFPLSRVIVDSTTRLRATVPAQTIPAGTYGVKVTLPGGATAELPNAFRAVAGGRAELVTNLVVPDTLGNHGLGTLYVEYANTGNVAMPAPLLVLTAARPDPNGSGQLVEGAFLSLSTNRLTEGLWTSSFPDGFSTSVQFLGSGATPGVLQPGESIRVPVYYAGWLRSQWNFADPALYFNLGVLDTANTTTVNWAGLKDGLRPAIIPAAGWDAIYPGLTAGFGDTWGEYVARLSADAAYLATLGENVTDVGRLFAFEVAKADGLGPVSSLAGATDALEAAPGLALGFGRSFSASILNRSRAGRFGLGWSDSWDTSASVEDNGTVVITGPGGAQRRFQPDSRPGGKYFAAAGDTGILTRTPAGGFRLREADGSAAAYRADGRLDFVEDMNGNRITAGYDASSRLVALTHSAGQKLILTYNAAGLVTAITDQVGRATTFIYDAANRHLLSVTNFDGTSTSYTYGVGSPQVAGALLSVVNPDGSHLFYTYDATGRLSSLSRDGGAETVTLTYGPGGEVTATDVFGGKTVFAFDDRGLLRKVTDALGRATHLAFDARFNLTKVTDPLGRTTLNRFDSKGNLTATTDALGHTTTFVYSGGTFTRPTTVIDANGHVIRYGYDDRGNLTTATYEDGTVERLVRDPVGQLLSSTNRRGDSIGYEHDAAGRVIRKTYSDGTHIDYAYDARGNLTSATGVDGAVTTLTYDANDRLTKITYPGGRFLVYTYDAAGRRTQMVDQDGFTVNSRYDTAGRLTQLTDGFGANIVMYAYDAAGRLSREDRGNGTFTTYEYDLAGQLLHLVNHTPDGAVNSRFDYTYDALGRRMSEGTLDGNWIYTYDALGQLTRAVFTSTNPDIPSQDLVYVYDAVGNRTQTIINGVTTTYTINTLNQYTQVGDTIYIYDADGNMVSQSDATGTTRYSYNSENRLTGITAPNGETWTYTYDIFGRRVAVASNETQTDYIYDPAGPGYLVGEYSDAAVTRYTHGLGLVRQLSGGDEAYYDFDAIGSTATLTGPSGIAAHYRYRPFGELLGSSTDLANPFTYVGKYGVTTDAFSLNGMGRREYVADLGRFASSDPIGLKGGDLNLYRYVANTPTNLTDPEGTILPLLAVVGLGLVIAAPAVASLAIYAQEHPNEKSYPPDVVADAYTKTVVTAATLPILAWEALPVAGTVVLVGTVGFTGWVGKETVKNALGIRTSQGDIYGDLLGIAFDTISAGTGPLIKGPVGEFVDFLISVGSDQLSKTLGNQLSDNISAAGDGKSQSVTAVDPNDLIGPSGFGPANFVAGTGAFPYRINFENDPDATAPAQAVFVTNQLPTDLDWTTFELTGLGFGDTVLTVPAGSQSYHTAVPLMINGKAVEVIVSAEFDPLTGELIVGLQTVDPLTQLPPDVLSGFLPPEDGTGRGQGFITYLVKPKPGLPTGTAIRNVARIIFDANPPIDTDQVDPHDPSQGKDPAKQALVTIDADAPTSTVAPLPDSTGTSSFAVSWSGDDGAGSGVASYDVFVSVDGGAFTLWQAATTATSAVYPGAVGHTYSFYSVAADAVGRVQPTPAAAQATVTVLPMALSLTGNTLPEFRPSGTPVGTLSVTPAGAYTFALVPGDGDEGNAGFAVVGNRIVSTRPFDAAAKSGYSIRVRATDGTGAFTEKAFTVTVTADPTVTRDGRALHVVGTAGDDVFYFAAGEAEHLFVLNGVLSAAPVADVDAIVFHGGGGSDTAVLYGRGQGNIAGLGPNYGVLTGTGFEVWATGTAQLGAVAGGAGGVAYLAGTAGDETFAGTPTYATLAGSGFSNTVGGFGSVVAYSNGGRDVAYLAGSDGDDTYVATPTYAILTGAGFYNQAEGFRFVVAYSNGGTDAAYLADSAGDDTFVATPSDATMTGATFFNGAVGFANVAAYATNGGTDAAFLADSPGNDTLVASGSVAELTSTGRYARVEGFEGVRVFGTNGGTNKKTVGVIGFFLDLPGVWVG